MLKRLFSLFVSQEDLNKPNTESFPYWQNPGVQNQYIIPGVQIAGMIEDIGINRIPSETDFLQSEIRTIPTVPTTRQDTDSILGIDEKLPRVGTVESTSLIDLFNASMSKE